MNSSSGLIASFSQDVHNFAFQTNISQKNGVDIYPLDSSNNYSVNSSSVSHIDYETNELESSDIIFSGWCSVSAKGSGRKTKRKYNDDNSSPVEEAVAESFYINVFSSGKLVVFSSGGKQIVNIIQLKKKLVYADTMGAHLWILDEDKTIKKFQCNQSKASKTFQLSDLKNFNDEAVVNFQVLEKGSDTILAVACETQLYLIDPNKKKPTIIATYNVGSCVGVIFTEDEKHVIAADKSHIIVYDYASGNSIKSWQEQTLKLRLLKDFIVALNTVGQVSVFLLDEEKCICKIRANKSEIIDFTHISNSIMISWINVNEPNFRTLPFNDFLDKSEIILDEEVTGTTTKAEINSTVENTGDDQERYNIVSPKKISKAEQDELTQSLISALDSSDDSEQISSIMLLSSWSEQRIKSFIITEIQTDIATRKLLEAAIIELQKNLWDLSNAISIWLKWLITLRGDSTLTKDFRKQLKHIKAGLRSSIDTLPTLLGIQGRLEMLKKQEQMREELNKLNIAVDDVDGIEVENGDAQGNGVDSDDINESISYANGEGDTFVDASEYRNYIK